MNHTCEAGSRWVPRRRVGRGLGFVLALAWVAGLGIGPGVPGATEAGPTPASSTRKAAWPGPELNLRLAAPIDSWDEAVPLGNGKLGGLLWGSGGNLRLSLDRADLWDERPAPGDPLGRFTYRQIVEWVAAGKNAEISRVADAASYDQKHPTKIPAGRLEIRLGAGREVREFVLNLAEAEGEARLGDGTRLRVFFSATGAAPLLELEGAEPAELVLRPPESVRQLGYPEARAGREGSLQWFVQEAAMGLKYCVAVGSARAGGRTLLAVDVASTVDGADPLVVARGRIESALAAGYAAERERHGRWWKDFWGRSAVELPDHDVLRQYVLTQYFHGAASRLGQPPLALQGVWTADAGTLPPWKGDYHHDLNTQMTYMAYAAAGHLDEGRCFLDFLWDRLPIFRKYARDFFGTPGANVPGVMTLAGAPLGGWAQYSFSPTQAGWLAHLFYLHWRFTADPEFLRDRAYPWSAEVGESLAALLEPDQGGRLVLPTSSSPEIHDNSPAAWLKPNSNYDLAILRMLFLGLREMAAALEKGTEAARWERLAQGLGDFHADADGTLRINAAEGFTESHRHFSNLMNLYPFNLTTIEGTERDRAMIRSSLALYDRLGTQAWCGYSFAWMAAMRARTGEAEVAAHQLDLFVKAFVLRNGFHANGDQTKSGLSGFTYRPFTLEGNFLAAAALQEMLVQGWSPHPGSGEPGVVRVFPAMPWRWHDAAFTHLRVEGGRRVSARRENNATTWLHVESMYPGPVRIRDNFGGRTPRWSRTDVRRVGQDFVVELKAGEGVEATLDRPASPPAKPADAQEPWFPKK